MKDNWRGSLRTKIIAWSFVPMLIILPAVAWFTYYSYQEILEDLVIKQYPEIVQPKSRAFSDGITSLVGDTLVTILLEIDVDHELPLEARAQNILENAPGLDMFDGGIYFLDQQGKIFKTHPAQPGLIGQDWSGTPTFRSINEVPNLGAFTDLITLAPSGKKVFCTGFAMAGETWTDVLGATYYCFTIYPPTDNAFYQYMKGLDLGPDLYVVDRNHEVIFSPDLAEMGKDLSGEAYIQQLLQGESQCGRFRIQADDVVVCDVPGLGAPSDRINWSLVAQQRWDEILKPSLAYQRLLLVALALGVVVPVLLALVGINRITDPIQKLMHAAEQLTAGKFKHRIEVKTGDEIEALADQFNLMSAKLDDSYASLEKKVADRTQELAILNSIISVASHSLHIQEILEDALNNTVEQMGFDAGSASRFEEDPTSPQLMAHRGFDPAAAIDLLKRSAITSQRIPVYPNEVFTFQMGDLQDEKLKDELSRFGFQLMVYVPLSTKGRELGLFILGKHEAGQPSPEELSLLRSIGKQVGVAMENARLYEEAEQAAIAAERHRLARELHDAVTQTLFSANLIADVIPRIWKRNPDEGLQNLEELRQLTRGALAEMRTLLLEMRPEALERSDIKALLTQLADAFVGRVRVPVSLDIQGNCELTHEVKIVFYRVAQEALNNIAKHSGARQVVLRLECQPGQMKLFISDNGLGFEPESIPPDHMGIAIMRERATSIGACLKIESQPGQGTTVELDWSSAGKDGTDEYLSTYPCNVGG